jgi:hypothetical protein
MLDYLCGGAAATRPSARWISYATGIPNNAGASDGPINTRQTITFAAANSPQGSATNANLNLAATATAGCTVRGWNLWDAAVGGNRLAYGTMTLSFNVPSANSIRLSAGRLRITVT